MLELHRVEIIDTAGLHLTEDSIEQQGINKTLEQAQSADFFLLIMDSSQPPPVLPAAISAILKPNNTIVIENKIDLAESKACPDYLKDCLHCPTSIIQKQGIEEFKKSWQSFLDKNLGLPNSKDAIVLNTRHTQSLKDSLAALNEALQKLDSQEFSELVALDLRTAIDGFSQVVGKIDNEAMLDKLFQKFCIGK
jgi:tRNA modification GTPase